MDRKPPFLESELKKLIKGAEENLEKTLKKIQETYEDYTLPNKMTVLVKELNWAAAFATQIKKYKEMLRYYDK